jgi:hypothetical protein
MVSHSGFIRGLLPILCLGACRLANSAAIDDITLQVSTDICDGSNPADKSYVVYATNANTSKRIGANFKYDSNASTQSFPMLDAKLANITDRFPKFHERRLAPGERAEVGCTINYRASSQPRGYTAVAVVITKVGAVYVDPSKPEPQPENALGFVAFYSQTGFSACESGSHQPDLLYIVNQHPFLTMNALVDLSDGKGKQIGQLKVTLAPSATTRAGCSNGYLSPLGVGTATFSNQISGSSKHN